MRWTTRRNERRSEQCADARPHGQWINFFHAFLKLEGKERREGRLVIEKGRLNPFALKRDIKAGLKEIARMRQLDAWTDAHTQGIIIARFPCQMTPMMVTLVLAKRIRVTGANR